MTPRTVVKDLEADTRMADLRNQEEVIGVVLRREILAAMAEDRWNTRIPKLMAPAEFVVDSMRLDRLLNRFLNRRQHLLVVIDEYGSQAGVVTLEDVLEEMLGQEIVDEFDETRDIRALAREKRQEALAESI